MKRIQAFVAAVLVTGLLALCMLAVGLNAALNTNTVPIENSLSAPAPALASTSTDQQAQVNQLQSLIQQYQSREKQNQTQLNQATSRLQQYQSIIQELQRRGIIRMNADGTIQLRVRGADREED